ncbi:MAG: leucine-rich repeat domain-containing protein [Bacilli bacterium]|nr:leucine-rich repeat domain-containing protein [Bacilli bacterium]
MSKKEIDEELLEELEEAQKEYNENIFEEGTTPIEESEEEQSDEEQEETEEEEELDTEQSDGESEEIEEEVKEDEEVGIEPPKNDKKPFNTKKWLYIVVGSFAVFLIVFFLLLLNKKNEEVLMAESNYDKAIKKIEQQEEKINKMTDRDKVIAGIKVDAEKEKIAEKEKEKQKENQTDTYKIYENMTEEQKEQQEVIPREEKVPIEELEKVQEEEDYKPEEQLPAKFNLNDKIKIEVENQDQFGLCWDFASTSSLQTHYALKNNKPINLSKIHVDYLMSDKIYGYRDIHDGGSFSDYEEYLLLTNPVETKTLEYRDYPEVKSIDFFLDQKTTDIRVTNAVDFPNVYRIPTISEETYQEQREELINTVKHHIMKNGSVYASILAPDAGQPYYDSENNALYYDGDFAKVSNSRGFHAVSIIGWDDNYSKEKFNSETKPNKDGAFIALNSWSESWGNNGYFYISYEDESVLDALSGITSISLDDTIALDSIKSKAIREILDRRLSYSYFTVKGKTYIPKLALQSIFDLELNDKNLTDNDTKELAMFENLSMLDLSNNKIKDISFLKDMKRLGSLNLANNEIEDITTLKDMRMYNLNLAGNKIKDVSILESMPELYSLDISKNEGIVGFDKLSKVSILHLSNTNTDFSTIANLTELSSLDVSNNDISTLPKDLNQLKYLTELKLDGCNISTIDELPAYNDLIGLSLKNNKLTDLTGIKTKFSKFTALDLSNNNIEDIKQLNDIDVSSLILANNKISSLEGFKPNNVMELNLSGNKNIKNLEVLNDSEIYYLELKDINLKDLSEVKKLTKVQSLVLDNNSIEDVKDLSDMTNLLNLSIQKNNIKDINLDNSKLSIINLADNNLENISIKNNENLGYINISNNKNIKNFWKNIENNKIVFSIVGEKISLNSDQVSDIIKTLTEKGQAENVFFSDFDLEYKEKKSSSKITITDSNVRRAILNSMINEDIENGLVDAKARNIEVIDSSKDVRIKPAIFSIDDFHQFIYPTIVIK